MKTHFTSLRVWAVLAAFVALSTSACTESVEPDRDASDGYQDFEGQIDPSSGTALMKTITVEGRSGIPIRIELLGRFVRPPVQPGEIALAVSIRNADERPLYAPGELVLSNFRPESVMPAAGNPDYVACPTTNADSTFIPFPAGCLYGYDFTELLGDDKILSPRETSGEKLMVFSNPEGASFAFNVYAHFGMEPGVGQIAGHFFSDLNYNGVRDADEPPFGGGWVRVTGPGMDGHTVQVDGDGHYSISVRETGLYSLWASPPPTFAPVEPTTSNPLEVVLLRGADGQVMSFLNADFGWVNSLLAWPVDFVDSTDSLNLDPYTLMHIGLENRVLTMRVGISGCGPDHPLQLYMVGPFMESFPVQARMVLEHDDRDELCDAWFERDLKFDLSPIMRTYQQQYGGPGTVIAHFDDYSGTRYTFELVP